MPETEVSAPRAHVAFHLTGRRAAGELEPFDPVELEPALFARVHDLTALRYDYPLVLTHAGEPGAGVESLSGLFDRTLRNLPAEPGADRVRGHARRLEMEIRALVAQRSSGLFSALCREAADRLGARGDAALRDSLDRLDALFGVDGEIVDCHRPLTAHLMTHLWSAAHRAKALRFRERAEALVARLSDVLRADHARSAAGRTPAALAASFGTTHRETFDFAAMSRILSDAAPAATLGDARRQRIVSLIRVLESDRFYSEWNFVFESCHAALDAHRERLPHLLEVGRALAVAELEARGEYVEDRHDAFFEGLSFGDLTTGDLAHFPDYLVLLDESQITAADAVRLQDAMSAHLPFKFVLRTDDLSADLTTGIGVRSRQFTTLAIGLNHVFVFQAPASHVYDLRDHLGRGLEFQGPALFSIYSGDPGWPNSPPAYLMAAAALESRAFPILVYDPSAGPDWASRCDLEANPQVERDWPTHTLEHEDAAHHRRSEEVAFTLADFVACDPRLAVHFAVVAGDSLAAGQQAVAVAASERTGTTSDPVPCLWVVDGDHQLHRAIVDAKVLAETRRCRERWHSLRELGGIQNSFAARELARERREAEARARAAAPVGATPELSGSGEASAWAAPAVEPAVVAIPAGAAATAAPAENGTPYIETPRCSTCNECIHLNGRMFAYNENRQAYIKDPSAGTFRQLVEAAESCQVAIIHPGQPRDPDEPGLEELLERAAAFS